MFKIHENWDKTLITQFIIEPENDNNQFAIILSHVGSTN